MKTITFRFARVIAKTRGSYENVSDEILFHRITQYQENFPLSFHRITQYDE